MDVRYFSCDCCHYTRFITDFPTVQTCNGQNGENRRIVNVFVGRRAGGLRLRTVVFHSEERNAALWISHTVLRRAEHGGRLLLLRPETLEAQDIHAAAV